MKKKIFIILCGIGFSLVLVELILRFLGFGYNVIYKLSQEPRAGYGIFCVGESTTWGVGTDNPREDNYPKQLEEMLSKRFPEKKIRCFFDQTIGQNTSEILLKLPFYIEKYQPRIVVLMVGVNNWWNLDKSNILLFNRNTTFSKFTLDTLIFLDKFRLWKLLKWLKLSLGLYKERWNYWCPEGESPVDMELKLNEIYGDGIWQIFDALTEHDITEMVKICKMNNIKVIISSYPMESIGGLYRIQKKVAKTFGVPFVDNYLSFQKILNREEYLWNDGWHPNKKGYGLVAKNIYDCIVVLVHNSFFRNFMGKKTFKIKAIFLKKPPDLSFCTSAIVENKLIE